MSEVDRLSIAERTITVSHCECGLRWSGGNSKYCPAGHPYRFVDETYVPASQLEGAVEALERVAADDCKMYPPLTMALRIDELEAQLAGAVSALESAYDAMVHRPVDSELFRAAIRDVAAALGRDEDYDDPPAEGQ